MPDFIIDNFGLVVVVVVSIIAVVRKVLEAATGNHREDSTSEPPIPHAPSRPPRRPYTPPPLGRPGSPPPLRPPPTPPPLWEPPAADPPTAYDTAAELNRQQEMEERLRKIREAKTAPSPDPLPVGALPAGTLPIAAHFAGALPIGALPPRPAAHRVLHRRLRHPQEIRRAVILKEILDRPIALRDKGSVLAW
jgi:hypothetical protein